VNLNFFGLDWIWVTFLLSLLLLLHLDFEDFYLFHKNGSACNNPHIANRDDIDQMWWMALRGDDVGRSNDRTVMKSSGDHRSIGHSKQVVDKREVDNQLVLRIGNGEEVVNNGMKMLEISHLDFCFGFDCDFASWSPPHCLPCIPR